MQHVRIPYWAINNRWIYTKASEMWCWKNLMKVFWMHKLKRRIFENCKQKKGETGFCGDNHDNTQILLEGRMEKQELEKLILIGNSVDISLLGSRTKEEGKRLSIYWRSCPGYYTHTVYVQTCFSYSWFQLEQIRVIFTIYIVAFKSVHECTNLH